jgi:hypothetical protein
MKMTNTKKRLGVTVQTPTGRVDLCVFADSKEKYLSALRAQWPRYAYHRVINVEVCK